MLNKLPSNEAIVKSSFASTKGLIELNAKYAEKALNNAVSVANLFIDSSETLVNTLSKADVKDVQGFAAQQKELFAAYKADLTEVAESNVELVKAAAEDYKEFFASSFNTTSEEYKAWFQGAVAAVKAA